MACNSFLCIAITSITTTATATTTTTPPALIRAFAGGMTSKKDWIRIRRIAEKKEGGHKTQEEDLCVFYTFKLYCNVECNA